jgi:arylsulfatase A-like enzyme
MNCRRRITILFFCLIIPFGSPAKDSAQPNIVFIIAEDMELTDLGCYGGELPTPHIDRLAREGMAFTRHHPAATVCTPSRYAILTGQFPSTAASVIDEHPVDEPPMIRWNTFIEAGQRTLATVAKAAGYDTGFVGKWHNGHPEDLRPIDGDADPRDLEIAAAIRENYAMMKEYVRTRGGFDFTGGIYTENVIWIPLPAELEGHNQHWLTQEGLNFLRHERDLPFLLYFSSTLPHPPHVVESLERDPRATVSGLRSEHLDVQPSYEDVLARLDAHGPYPADYDPFVEPYARSEAAGILWLDDAVGTLYAELEASGELDNTFILFAADHDRRGKMVLNRGQAPLIIRAPGHIAKPGTLEDALVSNIDFLPTVCELIGMPASSLKPLPGKSLLPLLSGEVDSLHDAVYSEINYTRSVITEDFKYIATRFPSGIESGITAENRRGLNQEGRRSGASDDPVGDFVRYNVHTRFPGYFADDQLYDLRKDPQEQNNLAYDPEYAEKLAEMKQQLRVFSQELPHAFGEFTE